MTIAGEITSEPPIATIDSEPTTFLIHPMATMRGPIDVHVHLSGNGKGGMGCWHRRRWIMKPFLWAGARDIGLKCGFGDLRFDELYLNKLLQWVSGSTLEAALRPFQFIDISIV